MSRLNYLHICENAFLSEGNRNLNLIGIFDTINTMGFPATQPRFAIVANLTADTSTKHKTTLLIKRGDKKLFELNMSFDGVKHQIIQNFLNFPFPEQGNYEVSISLDDTILGSTTITLNKIGNL